MKRMDLPLIAVPRLLTQYHCLESSTPSKKSNEPSKRARLSFGSDLEFGSTFNSQKKCLMEMQRLLPLSLLDFPAELIASSIACLWNDLASEESRLDFLRFQKGWIPHAVLLGCLSGNAVELVMRVIEIACFLDLLCQKHRLAAAIVDALKSKSISRLALWESVPNSLIRNMNEISLASLAPTTPTGHPFQAARDLSLEYWLLTRPYVSAEMLIKESLCIQPQRRNAGDVETRINQLEALVSAINEVDEQRVNPVSENHVVAESFLSESSDADSFVSSNAEGTDISSSEPELSTKPGLDSVYQLAFQTKERISRELEYIKDEIHHKAVESGLGVEMLGVPTQTPRQGAIEPLDQRLIFRVRANFDNKARQRKSSPTALHHRG